MFTLTPPCITPMLTVTFWTISEAPFPSPRSMPAMTSGEPERASDLVRRGGRDRFERFEVADERGGDPVGARAHVGISAVPAGRAHGELHPVDRLLAEPHGVRAARLAVQHAVAEHLVLVVLDQVSAAPSAAGLLVRDERQREPTCSTPAASWLRYAYVKIDAVVPHFMSTVPRPCNRPSTTSPDSGSRVHSARSPIGNTSM